MPELPEVETYIRELAPQLLGRRICRAHVFWPRTIAAPDTNAFITQIQGLRFTGFGRRGKYMLLSLTDAGAAQSQNDSASGSRQPTLIIHLRMTGKLSLVPASYTPDKHTHVILDLDDRAPDQARLIFVDSRKFGRIWLTQTPERVLARLGPEPLSPDFSPLGLGQKLAGRRAAIKALLLDQAIVAGIGNIYADEALFRAQIHPTQAGGALTAPELGRLHAAVCCVLEEGIKRQGSSLGGSALQNYMRPSGEQGGFQDEHRVFRRTGQACYTCGTAIERIIVAQRSTHYCPTCQPMNP